MPPILKKSSLAVIAILAIAAFITLKPSSQTDKTQTEKTLVIGVQSGYPPFEFMDANGKIIGFDIAIAERIAQKLGKTLVINDMEFEGEILSLKQGKIDLIISGMNITPSRLKEINMIPYHGDATTSLSLIFWKKIPERIQSLDDLAKLSEAVAVESGSLPEIFINNYAKVQVKSFQGSLAPLMDVKYGKSIANLVQTDVAEYLKKQHSEIKILNIPLPEDASILGFGIGVKKENVLLSKQIEEIIQELKASGELQQLEDLWFKGGKI